MKKNKFKIGDTAYLKVFADKGKVEQFIITGILDTTEGVLYANDFMDKFADKKLNFKESEELLTKDELKKTVENYHELELAKTMEVING